MIELMTLDDIATLWHCSRRHARDILVKTPGFPPPAPGSTPRHQLWLRSKIMAFLNETAEEVSS